MIFSVADRDNAFAGQNADNGCSTFALGSNVQACQRGGELSRRVELSRAPSRAIFGTIRRVSGLLSVGAAFTRTECTRALPVGESSFGEPRGAIRVCIEWPRIGVEAI